MAGTGLQRRVEAALRTFANTGSKAAAAGAFVYPSSMTWQGRSGFASIAPRNTLWRNADPLENSAVINTLSWITRNFGQAEFGVCRQNRKGEKERIVNHPLQQLLERPNPWYGGQTLWAGTLLSYHLDGNAYWIKIRNARGFGVPTAIWYEPHWSIRPHWPTDGSEFIDYYERHVNGRNEKIPPENIVHFRNGLNPANPRYGVAPIRGALLNVFTDQEIDAWIAALARNMAIPGVVVNPTTPIGMTPEKAEAIKQTWKRKFGGDNRGEPLILDFEADVSVLGFDPKSMDFTAIHHHAESRIAGALGVPPQLTYLDVANQASSFNNLTTFERIGWEQCLVPSYENLEDTIDATLLPDFESDPLARGLYCEFDTSNVRALKEDQNAREKRTLDRVAAGVITVMGAQAELGQEPDAKMDFYLLPSKATPATGEQAMGRALKPPEPATPADGPGKPAGKGALQKKKSFAWEGIELGREPSELEQLCIKQIAGLMANGSASVGSQMLSARERWIRSLADDLANREVTEYGDARIEVTERETNDLTDTLDSIFENGAQLIVDELNDQGAEIAGGPAAATDAGLIAELAGAALSRLAVETLWRAVASATTARTLNVPVRERIENDFASGSTAYVERIARGSTNIAVARGREAEIKERKDQYAFLIYSAVLDKNTCEPCGRADGETGQAGEIPVVPNPRCQGGDNCRCVHIAAFDPDAPKPARKPTPKPAPVLKPKPAETPAAADTGANARARLAGIAATVDTEIAAITNKRSALVEQFLAATGKRRAKIDREIVALDHRAEAIELARLPRLREALYQSAAADFRVETLGFTELYQETTVLAGGEEFKRFVGRGKLEGRGITARYSQARPHYSLGLNEMHVASQSAVVHEMGHWLEDVSPEIHAAILGFYDRRTAGDAVERLSDLIPGGAYDPTELTRKDRFRAPYVGKLYEVFGIQTATEVLSMGLQYFYDDPAEFAKDDPDYFDFIYNLLRK